MSKHKPARLRPSADGLSRSKRSTAAAAAALASAWAAHTGGGHGIFKAEKILTATSAGLGTEGGVGGAGGGGT